MTKQKINSNLKSFQNRFVSWWSLSRLNKNRLVESPMSSVEVGDWALDGLKSFDSIDAADIDAWLES